METHAGGVSLLGVMGIVFVILKLVGVIGWSWWLVLLPFWGPTLAGMIVLGILGVVALKYGR